MLDYTWPGKYKPMKHQEETVSFFLENNGFCLNGMGTGKTLCLYWAIDYLISKGIIKKALVISPLSTLETVHLKEIEESFPHLTAKVIKGEKKARITDLLSDWDIAIINHDALANYQNIIKSIHGLGVIAIDEVAGFRNYKTKKYKALKSILKYKKPKYFWGMTGTPTPNSPLDAFFIGALLGPTKYSFPHYKELVTIQIDQFRWIPRPDCQKHVIDILSPCIRFSREECLDLPETTYQKREVKLSEEQRKLYGLFLKNMAQDYHKQDKPLEEVAKRSKLLQICSGILYAQNGEDSRIVHNLDCKNRLEETKQIIEDSGSKVIVFVPFTEALSKVHEELSKHYICAVVDGNTSLTKRSEIFDSFQHQSELRVIIAHPGTMAHGITLTAANTIIYFSPPSGAEVYQQSQARIIRAGQTQKTSIISIYGTQLEKKIYDRLQNQLDLQGLILEEIERLRL